MGNEERTLNLNISLGTQALMGRRNLNHAEAADQVLWAEKLVVEGKESTSINILADLEPPYNWFEVDRYFEKALKELQVTISPKDILINQYAREVSENMVEGKVTPNDGLDILYQICVDMEYDSKYLRWMILDDEREHLRGGSPPSYFPNLNSRNFDKKVIEEALEFLAIKDK